MKTAFPNSAKRALSLVLAFVMLIGTLFVANVGVSINTSAETETTSTKTKILYWTGSADNSLSGSGTKDDPYLITTAEELNYVCTSAGATATCGKYYKVDETIKAFILQPESIATLDSDNNGVYDIMECDGYATTKSFFEGITPTNWVKNAGAQFNGCFDGSDVAIYGLYADGTNINNSTNRQSVGLFVDVDGGGSNSEGTYTITTNDTTKTINYDSTGITIGNFAIKNSYYKTYYRCGAVFGCTYGSGYGAKVDGRVALDRIEVSNCYFTASATYYDSSNTETSTKNQSEMGILYGGNAVDLVDITNVMLVNNGGYDNINSKNINGIFGSSVGNYSKTITLADGTTTKEVTGTSVIKNVLVLGTSAQGTASDRGVNYYSNTYTDYVDTTYTSTITVLDSADYAKGYIGKSLMGALTWATDATAGNGTTQWYAIEDEYPTLFMPDGWKDTVSSVSIWGGSAADGYASGTGTKEDPYIIRTAEQLYSALSTVTYTTSTEGDLAVDTSVNVAGGYQSDRIYKQDSTTEYVPVYTPYYYKVADDVDAIYLNNVLGKETLDAIKTLVSNSKAKNWAPGKIFVGELDGNGVTIYGMYCSGGYGLVYQLDGTSAVKNFNFDSCYSTSSGNTALVTTKLGSYKNDTTTITVANVSVRNSYLCSTKDITLGTTTSNDKTYYTYSASASGVISTGSTCEMLAISNCLYDGYSCERSVTSSVGATEKMFGGIISGGYNMNNVVVNGCVSLNAPVVDEVYISGSEIFYNRYDKNQGFEVYFYDSYTDQAQQITTAYEDSYDKLEDITRLTAKDVYEQTDMPFLRWGKEWQLTAVSETRTIPMPMGNYKGGANSVLYNSAIMKAMNNVGAVNSNGITGNYGKYGWEEYLSGSGTEEDPFLITTALELAQAIGSGGKQYHNPYYYKLTCDIDISGSTWINTSSVSTKYVYVPFEGTIDGDGHTITGLSCVDTSTAGFIPVLNGGTVKDLHFRDCYAGSTNYAGIIAGQVISGTITGCSVENSIAVGNNTSVFTGNWGVATVTNSYLINNGTATYVCDTANATVEASGVTDLYSKTNTDAVWYVGVDGLPRLTSLAKSHTVTDVDGDGLFEDAYTATDIVALRNCLLDREGYGNIYADVSRNGKVNISDLAILRRMMVEDYNTLNDGFWRNVEIGAVEIYYDENDNYDFARRAQIYLESLYNGLSIKKYTADTVVAGTEEGTPSGTAYIYIKTDTDLSYDQYKIAFDTTNLIVTISGGSFTAVEEAVNKFVSGSDSNAGNSGVYTCGATSIDEAKNRKWVDMDLDNVIDDNEYVYYAWGDEFEDEKGTNYIDTAIWQTRNYKNEGDYNDTAAADVSGSFRYLNLESPVIDALDELWEVKEGKLHIWRGIDSDNYSEDYAWGYKSVDLPDGETSDFNRPIDSGDIYVDPGLIQTKKSMLFKQGYSEMCASLPSDGHAFPAWWFYNGTEDTSNTNMGQTSLYRKVYALNNGEINCITGKKNNPNESTHWNGENTIVPTNLATYKYTVPQAYLEFDIVEFMQAGTGTQYTESGSTRTGLTTGDWRDYMNLTIHKCYGQHATSDGYLYIPDWSTGDYITTTNSSGTAWKGMSRDTFVNTASNSTSMIHRYNPDETTSAYPYTVTTGAWFWEDETATSASYSVGQAITKGALSSGKTVTDTYNYGWYWTVDESAGTYALIVYVDFNEDGNMSASEMVFKVDQTVGHEYDDPTWGNTSASTGSDAAVWNQYAYMLIDNAYYTSNPYGTATRSGLTNWGDETGVTLYTDLLTQDSNGGTAGTTDKTTFDIEYVRVYQQDGRRDLVLPETEDFNTNTHFGY